jgi:hypothetical protein
VAPSAKARSAFFLRTLTQGVGVRLVTFCFLAGGSTRHRPHRHRAGRPEPGRPTGEDEIDAGLEYVLGVDTAGSGLPDVRAMRRVG